MSGMGLSAIAEIYLRYFQATLKSISTTNVTTASKIQFAASRSLTFTEVTDNTIDAEFEVIYIILADADSSTTSGLSSAAEMAIALETEDSVEVALQELVELTDIDDYSAGDTNFLTEPSVFQTDFENSILAAEVIISFI